MNLTYLAMPILLCPFLLWFLILLLLLFGVKGLLVFRVILLLHDRRLEHFLVGLLLTLHRFLLNQSHHHHHLIFHFLHFNVLKVHCRILDPLPYALLHVLLELSWKLMYSFFLKIILPFSLDLHLKTDLIFLHLSLIYLQVLNHQNH